MVDVFLLNVRICKLWRLFGRQMLGGWEEYERTLGDFQKFK